MAKTDEVQEATDQESVRQAWIDVIDAALADDASAGDAALIERAVALLRDSDAGEDVERELVELVESHLTEGLAEVVGDDAAVRRRGELVAGTLMAGQWLSAFAAALRRQVGGESAEGPEDGDYSFAGRADFIALEEVLQLLGGGKHRGRLCLENSRNRLDVYLDNSSVVFLDPYHLVRRVLPSPDRMSYREIGAGDLADAESRHQDEGVPVVVSLQEAGVFRDHELTNVARALGLEVLYEFLRDQVDCRYRYERLNELPAFAVEMSTRLPVTPILLEGNKRLDDWRGLTKVFPDPDAPLEPVEDMYARIGAMDLGVLEIKLLSQLDGTTTPAKLAPAMGLPLHDVYQYLVRFAKAGVLVPPVSEETLTEVAVSIEESVELAIQALDANDDDAAVANALDKVLGDDGPLGGL